MKRTRLAPEEIADLLSLCLESSDFTYNNRHHTTNDSGPIGLSLMVTTSQIWMIHSMESAIEKAKEKNIPTPQYTKLYMDDCFCAMRKQRARREGLRSSSSTMVPNINPVETFKECLNNIHSHVKFTHETEDNNSIAFLDVLVTRQKKWQNFHSNFLEAFKY
jgi:hypothetical protein